MTLRSSALDVTDRAILPLDFGLLNRFDATYFILVIIALTFQIVNSFFEKLQIFSTMSFLFRLPMAFDLRRPTAPTIDFRFSIIDSILARAFVHCRGSQRPLRLLASSG